MAKNRVTPDLQLKKKDNFFNKSKTSFKSKSKLKQNKPNFGQSKFKTDKISPTKDGNNEGLIKPSVSGSNIFFAKSAKTTKVSNKTLDPIAEDITVTQEKKPFDKKTWRLKKYSNKYKLQQWEDKRNKAVLRGYYRDLKEDEPKFDVEKIYSQTTSDNEEDNQTVEENENNLNTNVNKEATDDIKIAESGEIPTNSKQKKNKAFKKAHLEFERIKGEKLKKREDGLKQKAEKEEALNEYKKKKAEKFKKLNRKTKKGQPIMKDRIEMLLERIQNSLNT